MNPKLNSLALNKITPEDIKPFTKVTMLIDLTLHKSMKIISRRTRKKISLVYEEAIEYYLDKTENYGWDHENK